MNQRIFLVLVLVFRIISAESESNGIPVFKRCSEYGKHIMEDLEVGSIVLQVSATVETVNVVDIEYTLLSNDRFKVDPISGQITTNYKFDGDEPENKKEELITVCATNKNNPKLKGTCDIIIVIDDINDNPPIFHQTDYHDIIINIKKQIVSFVMKDFNLIAILVILVIIIINILVCCCCFCRTKRTKRGSHDFTSTDNSLYFFGSERRDSFNMIETKAMNNFELKPQLHCTRNYSCQTIEEPLYQECPIKQNRDSEVYDDLTFNDNIIRQSSTPNESFYKTPTSFISNRVIFPELHVRPTWQLCNKDQISNRTSAPCYANIQINVKK